MIALRGDDDWLYALLELLRRRGLRRLDKTPGITTITVDERWVVKVNPHCDEIDKIPSCHFFVEYNGWPAGLLAPNGSGEFAAGSAANIEEFVRALTEAT